MTAVLMVAIPTGGALLGAVLIWGALVWITHRIVTRLAGGTT